MTESCNISESCGFPNALFGSSTDVFLINDSQYGFFIVTTVATS